VQRIIFDSNNTFDVIKVNKNLLVYSALKGFYQKEKSDCFVIRYVIEGTEHYHFNGHYYPVKKGQYLLSNATQEGDAEIDNTQKVLGICLGIEPDLIAEVVASVCSPDTPFTDNELGAFFKTSHFLENKYNTTETHLGQFLETINHYMQNNAFGQIEVSPEFFYTISEKIVADQIPIFKQLQAIPSIKSDTKKDLFRRIAKGKDFIDASFLLPLTIELIAKEACMSEYHFFRLFKSIVGISPHQYILKKRLEFAKNILKQDKTAVSIAAYDSGFSDIHAFSKAFKKHFGYSPSTISRSF
jgi:AraC family transcriptional regulator